MADASCGPFEEDARADLAPEIPYGGLDSAVSLLPFDRPLGPKAIGGPGGAPTDLTGVAPAIRVPRISIQRHKM